MSAKKWRAVNMQFVKKEKEAIKAIEPDPATFQEAALDFAFAGYKVGFSFDPKVDCYILAITGKDGSGDDENKTFMAFHSHREVLASIVIYLRELLTGGETLSHFYDRFNDSDW